MAPPSVDNGKVKVKKDITKLPWRYAHHIRVIYTVNGMLLCLGYGCSSAFHPPPPLRGIQMWNFGNKLALGKFNAIIL